MKPHPSFIAVLSAVVLVLAACGGEDTKRPTPGPVVRLTPNTALEGMAPSVQAVGSTTALGAHLYRLLAEGGGNFVFSPFGIGHSLAALTAGAGGGTAAEMSLALRFPPQWQQIHQGFATVREAFPAGFDTARAAVAIPSGIWAQEGTAFSALFTDLAYSRYGFEPRTVNLGSAGKAAEAIRSVLSAGRHQALRFPEKKDIPKRANLAVFGSSTVAGHWLRPFLPRNTKPRPFHVSPSEIPETPTILTVDQYEARFLDDGMVVKLPYVGEEIAVYLFAPRQIGNLPGIEARMDPDSLAVWMTMEGVYHVDVRIPRMSLRSRIALDPLLTRLGMATAFGPEADFSGVSEGEPLSLAAVIHEAAFDFAENGSGVAAASPNTAPRLSAVQSGLYARASCDRPFLFVVRHEATGAILLMGRVVEPES